MAVGTNLAKYLHYDQNLPLTKIQRSSITMKWFCWKLQKKDFFQVVAVFWSPSYVWPFVTPWTAACQASLSITNSQSLLKLMSNLLILCHPLLLPPSIFPDIRVFSSESVLCIMCPNYWNFSFSISPSDEHPGFSPSGWTGWISLQSKGLSTVFPTPQFKSINFLVLSFLYSPTLTSKHDHWRNHSLD